jgi:AcrR family transcriptional regulator
MARRATSATVVKSINGGDTLPEAFRSTAARLFKERGYARVTIDDIVREVGVTKGAFYHYFDSKGTLLFELHEAYVDYSVERIRQVLETETDPASQVRGYIRDVFSQIHEYADYVQVLFDERRELPADKMSEIETRKDEARKLLERVIERGVKQGVFRKQDARLTALAITGMSIWGYQWYEAAGRAAHQKIADAFADLVLSGLEVDG